MARTDVLARAGELRQARTPFVLATVVRALRPTSAHPGDQALVLPDGTIEGFVGGACAQSTVRLHALRLLAGGQATLLRIVPEGPQEVPLGGSEVSPAGTVAPAEEPTARAAEVGAGQPGVPAGHRNVEHAEGGWGDAADEAAGPRGDAGAGGGPVTAPGEEGIVVARNPCLSGGTLDIFLEVVRPAVLVQVVGDTPVARALVAVGAAMGWEMRRCADPGDPLPPDVDAVVVASQGGDEQRALTAALRAGTPYVGLVASRRRGAAVVRGLPAADFPPGRLHTPVGYDIGAHTPGEVAVSILAEIIAERAGGAAATGSPAAVDAAAGPTATAAEPDYWVAADRRPEHERTDSPTGVQTERTGPAVRPAAAAETTDPVCGMPVAAAAGSPRLTLAGTAFYFCGPGCRDAFAAEPRRYTARI